MKEIKIIFGCNPDSWYSKETEDKYYFIKDYDDDAYLEIDGVKYPLKDFEPFISDNCNEDGSEVMDEFMMSGDFYYMVDDDVTKDDIKTYMSNDICGNYLVIKDKIVECDNFE